MKKKTEDAPRREIAHATSPITPSTTFCEADMW